MRRMKKARQYLLGIFAALLLCGIFSVNTVKADTQYVYDNASLLSDEEEQDLERSCAEFESNTDIHMVILTEYSSGSEDCQAIADDFYDKKYPKEPNGVCFLIDMGQRQIVISTSGIMQYYMSDAEIDDILQAAQSYAKEGDYAGTFAKMITITQECFDRGVSEADYLITEDGSIIHYRKINSTEAMIAVLLAALTGFCVYFGIIYRSAFLFLTCKGSLLLLMRKAVLRTGWLKKSSSLRCGIFSPSLALSEQKTNV